MRSTLELDHFYPLEPVTTNATERRRLLQTDPSYSIRVLESTFYARDDQPRQSLQQTGVIGVLLTFTTPASTDSGPASHQVKRQKTEPGGRNRIMTFGDAQPNVNTTFAIVLPNKTALKNMIHLSNVIDDCSVGDYFLIYEPTFNSQPLGKSSNTLIIKGARCIVPLKRNISPPLKAIQMSPVANQQIYFHDIGCTVNFSCLDVKTGTDAPCHGTFCDRQNTTCTGCYGTHRFKRNFVIQVEVDVEDQPRYNFNSDTASFTFRSFHLTELFIANISDFAILDYGIMKTQTNQIRRAVSALSDYVNSHGGWTVIGWHRRGLVSTEEGASDLNNNTPGHIVRIEPTDLSTALMAAIEPLKYRYS